MKPFMYYLYLRDIIYDAKYCLVLQNTIIHVCEIIDPDKANGRVAADAIINWYKRFG